METSTSGAKEARIYISLVHEHSNDTTYRGEELTNKITTKKNNNYNDDDEKELRTFGDLLILI